MRNGVNADRKCDQFRVTAGPHRSKYDLASPIIADCFIPRQMLDTKACKAYLQRYVEASGTSAVLQRLFLPAGVSADFLMHPKKARINPLTDG
jgi:hypothetical protein